jgi:hypothetical protein
MRNIFTLLNEYFECKKLYKELIKQKKELKDLKADETNSELKLLELAYNKACEMRYDHTKAKIIKRTYRQGLDSYDALHELEQYKGPTNSGVCEDIAFIFLRETMKIKFKHFYIESNVGYVADNNPHAWVEVLNIDSRIKYKVDPTWKIFMQSLNGEKY